MKSKGCIRQYALNLKIPYKEETMAFLIVAAFKTDVDSFMTKYLSEDQESWLPTEVGAFETPSWPEVERAYTRLIRSAADNSITGRPALPVVMNAFNGSKIGKIMVMERVIKSVTAQAIQLK